MSAAIVARVARIGIVTVGLAAGCAAIGQPVAGQGGGQGAKSAVAPVAGGDAARIQKGRDSFNNFSCGSCHSLADAGATGHVGPSFDGNAGLSETFVIDRVTNGQGAMPAFGGQLSDEEIADLAFYVTHSAAKPGK